MDVTHIVSSAIGALSGGLGTYLTFRQQTRADAARTRIDLLRIVDERTSAFITRLESELTEKDEQITRLEKIVRDLRGVVARLLAELRRHDVEAAAKFEQEMP